MGSCASSSVETTRDTGRDKGAKVEAAVFVGTGKHVVVRAGEGDFVTDMRHMIRAASLVEAGLVVRDPAAGAAARAAAGAAEHAQSDVSSRSDGGQPVVKAPAPVAHTSADFKKGVVPCHTQRWFTELSSRAFVIGMESALDVLKKERGLEDSIAIALLAPFAYALGWAHSGRRACMLTGLGEQESVLVGAKLMQIIDEGLPQISQHRVLVITPTARHNYLFCNAYLKRMPAPGDIGETYECRAGPRFTLLLATAAAVGKESLLRKMEPSMIIAINCSQSDLEQYAFPALKSDHVVVACLN